VLQKIKDLAASYGAALLRVGEFVGC